MKGRNGEHHKVEVILQTGAPESETDRKEDGRQNGVGKAVLRMPLAAAATSHPQRRFVVEQVSIDLCSAHANPGGHRKEG